MKAVNRPPPEGPVRLVLERRFWDKVDKRGTDECWPWLAAKDRLDYGMIGIDYCMLRAYRVSWWLTNGTIPAGMCVLHTCDDPGCVNPAHLFLGTHADNMADMVQKRRQNAKLTEEDVRTIREEYATTTQRKLASKYGVGQSTISDIARRRTWKHVK